MIPDYTEAVATIIQSSESLEQKLQQFLDWAASSPRYRYLRIWKKIKASDLTEDAATVQDWYLSGIDNLTEGVHFLALNVGDCPEIYNLTGFQLTASDPQQIVSEAINESELTFHSDDLEESTDWDSFQVLADYEVRALQHEIWEQVADETLGDFVNADGAYAMWYGFAAICSAEAAKLQGLKKNLGPECLPLAIGFEEVATLLGIYEHGRFTPTKFEPLNLSEEPGVQIDRENLVKLYEFAISSLNDDQSYSQYALLMSEFAKVNPLFRSSTTDGILPQRITNDSHAGSRLKKDFELAEQWYTESLSKSKAKLEPNSMIVLRLGRLPEKMELSVITKAYGVSQPDSTVSFFEVEEATERVISESIILTRHVRELQDVIWHDYPVPPPYRTMAPNYLIFLGLAVKALHTSILTLRSKGLIPTSQQVAVGYGDYLASFTI